MIPRRDFLAGAAAAMLPWRLPQSRHPLPSPAQLAWQEDELALFLHFGVNTFTDREWGDGTEDPAIFAPAALDARQWARSARAAGFKAMILTAKHHDGFCLWPTRTTTHSVAGSPWRGGTGDLVREFVDACRAEGLKPGLYCSPWDRNAPVYGDSSRYNDMYLEQLTELLGNYGVIHEVWFDGANGEGPNGRRQVYDWPRTFGLVRRLQPEAVMFSDAGPDVRWIGNERGIAGDPNWSTVNPELVPFPGASGPGIIEALQHGNRDGSVWRPGETDVSIRPGWFYHPAEDDKVRSVENLAELYFTSVGRNSKLLLNVPPTRDGLLHETDVARLRGMREHLDRLFAVDLTRAGGVGRNLPISVISLREDITRGQSIARYEVMGSNGGAWVSLSRGTTIGYRKLDRIAPTVVRELKLVFHEALRPGHQVRIETF
jgi:alpha-L-fucosidase